jgi:hypothetical protein
VIRMGESGQELLRDVGAPEVREERGKVDVRRRLRLLHGFLLN